MLISGSGKSLPKRPAVFMDRDGTINLSTKPDGSYLPVNKPEDLVVFDGAKEGLKDLTEKTDFLKVLITNQGGIGAGYTTEEKVGKIHDKLLDDVRKSGGDIDAIYMCPTMDKSDPMRKPNPGMILKAAEDLNIDLANSYMIGDRTGDIAAGEKAHVTTILLKETGSGGKDGKVDVKSDVEVKDFKEASDFIIKEYEKKKNKS